MGSESYLAGPNFTMADIALYPFLFFSVRSGLNLSKTPNLASYYKRVKGRSSVKKSSPPTWEGTDGNDVFKDVL